MIIKKKNKKAKQNKRINKYGRKEKKNLNKKDFTLILHCKGIIHNIHVFSENN